MAVMLNQKEPMVPGSGLVGATLAESTSRTDERPAAARTFDPDLDPAVGTSIEGVAQPVLPVRGLTKRFGTLEDRNDAG